MVLFLSFVVITFLPSTIYAQGNTPTLVNNAAIDITSKNYLAPQNADYTVINLMHASLCQLAGMSPVGLCLANQRDGDKVKVVGYRQVPGGGAVGGIGNFVAALYNPPTSTAEYLADIGKNIGLVKPANAQSVTGSSGGQVLKPVFALWQFTQKLAYIAFIIIFLIVGFMIMLRRRINPQTVISIQNALPGLVIGLVMVTFSYFIAAFIIDLSFVSVQVVAQIFAQQANAFGKTTQTNFDPKTNEANLKNLANSSNIFDFLGYTVQRFGDSSDISGGLDRIIEHFGQVPKIIATIVGFLAGALIFSFAGPTGIILGGGGGALAGFFSTNIIAVLIPVILILGLTIQLFRLLFGLINTYIQLLVAAIFGPLYILVSSVPGRGVVLNNWLKSLFANSLVFPAVFATFLFAGTILATSPSDWTNPPPLFGGLPVDLLRLIIAYGVIMATPAIPELVRNVFGVKGPGNIAQVAIGGFVGGTGVLGRGYNQAVAPLRAQREAVLRATPEPLAGTFRGNLVRRFGFLLGR